MDEKKLKLLKSKRRRKQGMGKCPCGGYLLIKQEKVEKKGITRFETCTRCDYKKDIGKAAPKKRGRPTRKPFTRIPF